ncbi:MAG: hypothetical protein QME74_10520 [Candidatus Edwardsbacteria bacterium]|nr:hypothetical protein [Candidatus Edwardsbacteria bacterium]
MKTKVPLTIVLVLGIVFLVQYFVPSRLSKDLFNTYLDWGRIMGIPALFIAIDSLVRHHTHRIQRRKVNWQYSIIYLGAILLMASVGIFGGIKQGTLFMNLFTYAMAPMQATVFSLLAFYMTSAAYRAFRARTAEATVLLLAAFFLMLGLIPLGAWLWKGIPVVSEWLMLVPNMASKRAIAFGVGLGMAATSLKIVLGIERNWLGRK